MTNYWEENLQTRSSPPSFTFHTKQLNNTGSQSLWDSEHLVTIPSSNPSWNGLADNAWELEYLFVTNQSKAKKKLLDETKRQLTTLVSEDISSALLQFLKKSPLYRTSIQARHTNTFMNLEEESNHSNLLNKNDWLVKLSHKPLSYAERSFLVKGPKFALFPRILPVKNIVSEVEAAIIYLPDDSKDAIRTTTASLLHRANRPPHNNITKEETKSLNNLRKRSHSCNNESW